MTRPIAGYNVYEAKEGCAEVFLGFVGTLSEARELCDGDPEGLPESLYQTARQGGPIYGIPAPDKENEAEDPEWMGPEGWHCAVAVARGEQ